MQRYQLAVDEAKVRLNLAVAPGQNHGLGYCYVPGDPQPFKNWIYPPASLDNPSSQRFPDERGSATQTGNRFLGNELDHIINEEGSDGQFDWFVLDKAEGLTQAGLSRINQSIEAFVYCVLGAQVNVRSSILGEGGRAKEAQTEFLVLLEEAIRQPNLSKLCNVISWLWMKPRCA